MEEDRSYCTHLLLGDERKPKLREPPLPEQHGRFLVLSDLAQTGDIWDDPEAPRLDVLGREGCLDPGVLVDELPAREWDARADQVPVRVDLLVLDRRLISVEPLSKVSGR